jgi:hypothetical protein
MFIFRIFSIFFSVFIYAIFNLTKKRVWTDVGQEMFVFIPEVCYGGADLGTGDANLDGSGMSFIDQTGGYGPGGYGKKNAENLL